MKGLRSLLVVIFFFFTLNSNGQSNSNTAIKVFPNPATNVVNVLGLQNSNTSNITILDTYGNIVLRHTWEIKNNAINIPISSLTSGIYVITIHSKEQQVQTRFYKK